MSDIRSIGATIDDDVRLVFSVDFELGLTEPQREYVSRVLSKSLGEAVRGLREWGPSDDIAWSTSVRKP